jgi:glycosyltransferase involved in cell wall biosynthesis
MTTSEGADRVLQGRGPTVTVAMSTYGRRDGLGVVVPPLLAEDADEYVLIVNGSRDGSLELLQELTADDPRVHVHFLENEGLTRAQWFAAERATSDVILYVDDDVLVHPGLVAGHRRRHAEGPGRVVVGYMPTTVPEDPNPRSFTTRLYAQEYEGIVARWERNPQLVLVNLWMGNVSLRRADYLALEAHASAPGLRYHQDQHLGIAALHAGLVGVFDRSLRADHIHERSLEAFLNQARRQGWDKFELHALHTDVLGAYDARTFASGLPLPARALVRASRHELVHDAAVPALSRVVRLTGARGWYRTQTATARLLRRIEQQHGALSRAREPAAA